MQGHLSILLNCPSLVQVYVYCFVDSALGMYFPKSLKPEISVLYSTCYTRMLQARAHIQTHTECEEVGMVNVSGKFTPNEFINQIRKQQKYSVRIVKK